MCCPQICNEDCRGKRAGLLSGVHSDTTGGNRYKLECGKLIGGKKILSAIRVVKQKRSQRDFGRSIPGDTQNLPEQPDPPVNILHERLD